jgi:flavin-binding protein dodecin
MPIVNVIEVIASSDKSIEDALQNAVTEVSKTIHNFDWFLIRILKCM